MSSEKIIIGESIMNIHETFEDDITKGIVMVLRDTTSAGFEPARAEPNGLAVHRLNLSATSSSRRFIRFVFFKLD